MCGFMGATRCFGNRHGCQAEMAATRSCFCALDETLFTWKPVGMEVAVIGASLSGLALALACANRGIRVHVFERRQRRYRYGGALTINRPLLLRAIGTTPTDEGASSTFPLLTSNRLAASWQAVHGWLREQAERHAEISLTEGSSVAEIRQHDGGAFIVTSTGQQIETPVVIGADGYRSSVRRAVDPNRPYAKYAGYLLWRGLVPESALPPAVELSEGDVGVALVTKSGFRLVAYPVASPEGSLALGERLIAFTWYDKTRGRLLRDLGCVSESLDVLSSIAPREIPASVVQELRDLAMTIWPDPWRTAIIVALKQAAVFATPVAEYYPERLKCGRVAIIGDAAHVASPVTGMGLVAGLLDAETLAQNLETASRQRGPDVRNALEKYEAARLSKAQRLVSASQKWSQAYRHGVQRSFPASRPEWKKKNKL